MATSYLNPGGSGDRQSIIDISTNLTPAYAGVVTQLIDGLYADGYCWAQNQANGYVTFDFKTGSSKIITEAKLYFHSAALNTGVWKWQGSNDNISWTDVSGNYDIPSLANATIVMTINTSGIGYRYYRFLEISGLTDPYTWKREMDFKIDDYSAGWKFKKESMTGGINE